MKKYIIWFLLILLVALRYFSTRPVYNNGDLVRITATVYSDPIIYPTAQSFKIANLKVYLPTLPEINYGDRVVVEGTVDNGKLDKPKLISVNENQGLGSGIRNRIIAFYKEVLPQPLSGILAGIVLGDKAEIPTDFWQKITSSGIIFAVSASGVKITFLVSFLLGLATYFLSRRRAIPLVVFGIVLYLFLVGFNASIVRGAVMTFLVLAGQATGRLVSTWRVLILTGFIMLLVQPDWLTDIGFLLSFISLASIILFEKRIGKLLRFIPEFLREGLSVSLAAQIGMAPILIVAFGQFNLLSPVVSVLTLWTVPYVMILGSIGGMIGLIFPFLGKIVVWLSYPLIWWFAKIISIF